MSDAATARASLDDVARRRTVNLAAAAALQRILAGELAALPAAEEERAAAVEGLARLLVKAVFLNQIPGVSIRY